MMNFFQWTHVPGKLKWISSGRGVVVGVNSGNNIYYRKGLSAGRPQGSGWAHVPGKLMMIEIWESQVVGTNPGHVIFKSPVTGVRTPRTTRPSRPSGARRHLGCWRDKPRRAIAGGIRFRGSIAKCEQFARRNGFRIFAIQYGGECFTARNAHQTYRKYGRAGNCKNGKGGGWAQNVYTVGGTGGGKKSMMNIIFEPKQNSLPRYRIILGCSQR